jgi:hypothetical protein
MMYDYFSSKLPAIIQGTITPTSSISSSHISSIKKKGLPIATTTKSETTATLQSGSSSSSKFMSWMIPTKRTNDLTNDASSISSKKSSSSSYRDEPLLNSRNIDIDVNKLYEYSTKDLHTFGYPTPACASPVDSVNNNGNKTNGANPTSATANTANPSATNTNGVSSSASSAITPSSTITSINSTLDGSGGPIQKIKVTEIFEKNSATTKIVEKERYLQFD